MWFIQNLLRGLAALSRTKIQITVLVPSDSLHIRTRRAASRLKQAILHPSRIWQQRSSKTASQRLLWLEGIEQLAAIVPDLVVFDGSDEDLMRECNARRIDVLLPMISPPTKPSVPWVGYLFDCQHKHFPDFFSEEEITHRNIAFAELLRKGTVVFSNAKAVIADLQKFFPDHNAELFSLPFAPLIREEELTAVIRDSHTFRGNVTDGVPYFIVCNQFWVHKDHGTVIRAFAKFLQDPTQQHWRLVCTGSTEDYRAQSHFSELNDIVTELGIDDRVIFTGHIKRSQQQALLYGAAALVQPTLFEGGPGGGATSDAIALGVPCLLSDIAVNLEVEDPLVFFFRVGDPGSLALAMLDVARTPPIRPSKAMLLDKSNAYAKRLGETLLSLAERACAK